MVSVPTTSELLNLSPLTFHYMFQVFTVDCSVSGYYAGINLSVPPVDLAGWIELTDQLRDRIVSTAVVSTRSIGQLVNNNIRFNAFDVFCVVCSIFCYDLPG